MVMVYVREALKRSKLNIKFYKYRTKLNKKKRNLHRQLSI